jgi:hypothetical protein
MADYAKAAFDLKARLNAKAKRKADLNAFFEAVRSNIRKEVEKANAELSVNGAPKIDIRQESPEEPTIELACGSAICKISQDRSAPSIAATIKGETGEKTVTFILLDEESSVTAQRVSLAPANEEKVGPIEIASTFVEELIVGAP